VRSRDVEYVYIIGTYLYVYLRTACLQMCISSCCCRASNTRMCIIIRKKKHPFQRKIHRFAMRLPTYCVLLIRLLDSSSSFPSSPPSAGRPSASAVPSSAMSPSSSSVIYALNPLKSLFGNVASSISNIQQKGITNLPPDRMAELQVLTTRVLSSHNVGSWDEIRSTLRAKQTPDEQNFRNNLIKGYGKPSPLHKLRLFDESNDENDVRVTLFRDSASWCPYCQKVWMALEFKRVPYRVEKVNMRCYGDKPASFLRMQPSGNIPVAIIDGVTYNQSNDIIYALEEAFPEHIQLVPNDPKERTKAQVLLRLERTLFSAWMSWLTSGDSPNGRLRDYFISVLNEVDSELSATNGGFFLGEKASVVDVMFAPFLERMCASMLYFKGFQIRASPGEKSNFPAVNRWFV
jgi:glutathione S-transferase